MISIVEVELVLALAVPAYGRVQNRTDPLALVLPARNVGLGDLPHEGFVHQGDCSLRRCLSLSDLH